MPKRAPMPFRPGLEPEPEPEPRPEPPEPQPKPEPVWFLLHEDTLAAARENLQADAGEEPDVMAQTGAGEVQGDADMEHEHLMGLISAATGELMDAELEDAAEDEPEDPDWDDNEDVLGLATVVVLHGKACGKLGPDHELRVASARIVSHPAFEQGIVGTILVMMVALAYDAPSKNLSDLEQLLVSGADLLTCILFTIEAVLRIIAQGFCVGPGTYLRNSWNVLDLVIVSSAWMAVAIGFVAQHTEDEARSEELVELLRSLRLIRPLHLLRYLDGVKTMLAAVTYSGQFLATVTLLLSLFMLIFGSFGIELWMGIASRTCNADHDTGSELVPLVPMVEPEQCPIALPCNHLWEQSATQQWGNISSNALCFAVPDSMWFSGDWMDATSTFGFDNMPQAMLTLFVMTSLDEWPQVNRRMALSGCATCDGIIWPMMLTMVILLAFLGTNLFVAVVTYSYSCVIARQTQGKQRLLDKARRQDGVDAMAWKEGDHHAARALKKISAISTDTVYEHKKIDEQELAGLNDLAKMDAIINNPTAWPHIAALSPHCRSLVLSQIFDHFIHFVIVLNIAVMATHSYPSVDLITTIHTVSELIFLGVYCAEAVLKILGLGVMPYFSVPFHILDFTVVCASFYALFDADAAGSSAARMLRLAMRGGRLLKLLEVMGEVEQIKQIVEALTTTGTALLNLSGLITFFIILISTLTMHLLGNCGGIGDEIAIRSRSNFFTFGDSILANIQLLTGEDWAPIMFLHMDSRACGWWAGPFLIGVVLVYTFVLMNLFTAIVLQNFAVSEAEKMKNQRKVYEKKGGVEAVEEQIQVLEWLAQAAAGDSIASKAVHKSIMALNIGQETLRAAMSKLCFPCCTKKHPSSPRHHDTDTLLELDFEHARLTVELRELETELNGLGAEPDAGDEEYQIKQTKLTQVRAQLQEVHINIEAERKRLRDNAKNRIDDSSDFSCLCIGRDTHLRHFCNSVVKHELFDKFSLLAVIVSSACLVYKPETEPEWAKTTARICTAVFVVELILRVIDLNFVRYMRSGWNVLDFIIVFAACAEVVLPLVSSSDGTEKQQDLLGSLKVLRLLRLLRVLRAIRSIKQLKLMVEVLAECLPAVLAALAIVFLFYLCFGIFGLYIFAGRFYRCECAVGTSGTDDTASNYCTDELASDLCNVMFYGNRAVDSALPATFADPCIDQPWLQPNSTRAVLDDCCGDSDSQLCFDQVTAQVSQVSSGLLVWANPPYSFDTIVDATKTMFYMATTEGWVEIMNCGQDLPARPGLPPVHNASWTMSIYFVVFQVLGSSFCLALFTGVLVSYFSASSGSGILTKKQKEWVHVKLQVLHAHSMSIDLPEQGFRVAAHTLYTQPWWEYLGSAVILVQVLVIMSVHFPRNEGTNDIEKQVSAFCLVFFTFEITVGVLAIGLQKFLLSSWNRFDTIVVGCSWAAYVMEYVIIPVANSEELAQAVPAVQLQALRATRIIRILIVFKSSKNLKSIFAALVLSLPGVCHIIMLMLLVFFVFAVLGMHLYSSMPFGEVLNDEENFSSCWNAMKLLFEVATGHDFLHLIHEMQSNADADPDERLHGGAFIYFFVFYVAAVLVMTNLFIAMLLENVQISLASRASIIQGEHCDQFATVWSRYVAEGKSTKSATGVERLSCYDVMAIVREIDEPLGRIVELDAWEQRLLLEMDVGLKDNRRTSYVKFQTALMGVCVLYLSSSCLTYEQQHKRMIGVMQQIEETATRLIQCRIGQIIRTRRPPDSIVTISGEVVPLDTPERLQSYKCAVKVMADLCFNQIISCNKIAQFSAKRIKSRGKPAGEAKVRFERSQKSSMLVATVLEVRDLPDSDMFGLNDLYVIVSCNSEAHRTRTVEEAGAACMYSSEHDNVMTFQNAKDIDSLYIRCVDEDVGDDDDQLSATENLGKELVGYPLMAALESSEPYEAWFQLREEPGIASDPRVISRVEDDAALREMVRAYRRGGQQPIRPPRRIGSSDFSNPLSTFEAEGAAAAMNSSSDDTFESEGENGNVDKRTKRMDPDFHEKTQFFRVIRGAIVRVDADVLTSPIRGLLHPGEIVMALEFSECNANEHGKGDKVVQRVRIKSASAEGVAGSHVGGLQGWTSMETVDGIALLQPYNLFGSVPNQDFGTLL